MIRFTACGFVVAAFCGHASGQVPGEWIYVINSEAQSVQAAKVGPTLKFQNILTGLRNPSALTKQPGAQKFFLLDDDGAGHKQLVSIDMTGAKPKVGRFNFPGNYSVFGPMCCEGDGNLWIASSTSGEDNWIHQFSPLAESTGKKTLGPQANSGVQFVEPFENQFVLMGSSGLGGYPDFLALADSTEGNWSGKIIATFPLRVNQKGAFKYFSGGNTYIFAYSDLGSVDVYAQSGGQWHVLSRLALAQSSSAQALKLGIGKYGYAVTRRANGQKDELEILDCDAMVWATNTERYADSNANNLVKLRIQVPILINSFAIGTAPSLQLNGG